MGLRGIMALVGAMLALAVAPAARAEWRVASTDHFVLYADSSERWITDYATQLERFDRALRIRWGLTDQAVIPGNRVTIYFLENSDAMMKLCQCLAAGLYQSRAGSSVAFSVRDSSEPDFTRAVLFHEYTHHFMLSNFPAAYPRWFVEGFAEFHSTASLERDGSMLIGRAPRHRAFGLLTVRPIPERQLLGIDPMSATDIGEEVFYGRAWLMMHMLTFMEGRQDQLPAYVRAINSGTSNEAAATEAFGDFDQLHKDMEKYLRARRISAVRISAAALAITPPVVRVLTPGHAEMMKHRIQSDYGVTRDQALDIVRRGRRVGAEHPNDPDVQTALAEMEYDAGNDAEAIAAADRAIATDPKRIDAWLYKARARMRMLKDSRSTEQRAWAEARSWIVRANRADPDHAEPLFDFYLSFAEAGERPTANAIVGLNRAFELAPYDRNLRLAAARQYLTDGKLPEARRALAVLAYDPHAGNAAKYATRLIARIDAGDPGPAIAATPSQEEKPAAASGS